MKTQINGPGNLSGTSLTPTSSKELDISTEIKTGVKTDTIKTKGTTFLLPTTLNPSPSNTHLELPSSLSQNESLIHSLLEAPLTSPSSRNPSTMKRSSSLKILLPTPTSTLIPLSSKSSNFAAEQLADFLKCFLTALTHRLTAPLEFVFLLQSLPFLFLFLLFLSFPLSWSNSIPWTSQFSILSFQITLFLFPYPITRLLLHNWISLKVFGSLIRKEEIRIWGVEFGGVKGVGIGRGREEIAELTSNRNVYLYIHGGGFCTGHALTFLPFMISLLPSTSTSSQPLWFSVEYDLCPDHAYPTQHHQILEFYKGMLGSGIPSSKIIVMGDSAGGHLAFSLFLESLGMRPRRSSLGSSTTPTNTYYSNPSSNESGVGVGGSGGSNATTGEGAISPFSRINPSEIPFLGLPGTSPSNSLGSDSKFSSQLERVPGGLILFSPWLNLWSRSVQSSPHRWIDFIGSWDLTWYASSLLGIQNGPRFLSCLLQGFQHPLTLFLNSKIPKIPSYRNAITSPKFLDLFLLPDRYDKDLATASRFIADFQNNFNTRVKILIVGGEKEVMVHDIQNLVTTLGGKIPDPTPIPLFNSSSIQFCLPILSCSSTSFNSNSNSKPKPNPESVPISSLSLPSSPKNPSAAAKIVYPPLPPPSHGAHSIEYIQIPFGCHDSLQIISSLGRFGSLFLDREEGCRSLSLIQNWIARHELDASTDWGEKGFKVEEGERSDDWYTEEEEVEVGEGQEESGRKESGSKVKVNRDARGEEGKIGEVREEVRLEVEENNLTTVKSRKKRGLVRDLFWGGGSN